MRSAAVINNGLRRYVAYSILNLIIEWNPQIGFTSGFFVMRFLFVYTHVYTIFLGVPPIW